MSAIDWTKIYKKYKGLWVALKDDEITVVASGRTIKSVINKAKKDGFDDVIVMRVPKELTAFVGLI